MKIKSVLLKTFGGFIAAGILAVLVPVMAFAAGKATVTSPSGANIRSSASASSTIVGSALKNDVLDVLASETDSNGQVWYKVQVDANTVGYIRGDLVTVDGNAGNSGNSTTTSTEQNTTANTTAYTETEPVSGKTTSDLNVRAGASTSDKVIDGLHTGSALTVIGYTKAANGKTWYVVKYTGNSKEVTGYVISDYVKLSGELVDKQPEPEPEPEPQPEPEPEPEPQPKPEPEPEYKDYEAVYDAAEDTWYLNDYVNQRKTKISELYNAHDNLNKTIDESKAAIKKKNLAIIILVVLLVAVLGAAGYVFYRFKSYFGFGEDEGDDPMGRRIASGSNKTYTVSAGNRTRSDLTGHTVGTDDGVKAVVKPDPSKIHLPEGAVRLPDGRIQMPDGSIKKAVVGRKLPDGSIELPDGRIRKPDGTITRPAASDTDTILARGSSTHAVKEIRTNNSLNDDDDMEFGFINVRGNKDNNDQQ